MKRIVVVITQKKRRSPRCREMTGRVTVVVVVLPRVQVNKSKRINREEFHGYFVCKESLKSFSIISFSEMFLILLRYEVFGIVGGFTGGS